MPTNKPISLRIPPGIIALLALLAGCGDTSGNMPDAEPGTTSAMLQDSAGEPPAPPPMAYNACRSCHSVRPGERGVGPTLHGVFGRKAANMPGFNYSPALRQSEIVWDRASLDEFLAAPTKMVPGTRMVIGVHNAEQRKAVIDYLETLN